ncbi:MAG: homoserine dehydrogenase [Clostridiales bacterium]|nr:MAG: homoserine dehydrogenase [Clostridiales bacterium]
MVNVAVLGYGVVGSGVVELIDNNNAIFSKKLGQPIDVKYILDIRDFKGDKYEKKIIRDFSVIENDPEVSVVVETIGGKSVAYEFTKRALMAGKSVVSSNKELVATHAPELLSLARENGVSYLFEASVGGGIPIIRPMFYCLAANELNKIIGILNGTTNYILTKMIHEKTSFDEALKQAQELGYAEANPTADIDGHDTCRKICILAALAFGRHIYPESVCTKGIRNLTLDDIAKADAQGYVIKLLGSATKLKDGNVEIFVSPCAIKKSHALANIDDVFNGIMVTGDAVGDVTFNGRGAGKFPTASAVCSDVIDAASDNIQYNIFWTDEGQDFVRSFDKLNFEYLPGTDIPVIE